MYPSFNVSPLSLSQTWSFDSYRGKLCKKQNGLELNREMRAINNKIFLDLLAQDVTPWRLRRTNISITGYEESVHGDLQKFDLIIRS